MLRDCLVVGCGGFIGSVLRYVCSFVSVSATLFPYATFLINIVGSFAIMLFTGMLTKADGPNTELMLFLRVGLCGGFTTFSTFSAETLGLFENGNSLQALLYIVLSVLACIGAAWLGEIASSVFCQ